MAPSPQPEAAPKPPTASQITELRELQDENARVKGMLALCRRKEAIATLQKWGATLKDPDYIAEVQMLAPAEYARDLRDFRAAVALMTAH